MDDTVDRLKELLTYTEVSVVVAICEALGEENEQLIVGTKLAREKSISKGVVISALRLLHATGVVKTESVGSKGTRVIVLNRELLEAVAKFY